MAILRYEYDPKADALYIYLSDAAYAYGEELSAERRVDVSADGTPIGVELSRTRFRRTWKVPVASR